jgi:tRNA_anti-like
MSKKFKIILSIIILIGIAGFFGFNYALNGGARNLDNEESSFLVTSKDINSEFSKNIELANKKYLEKAIEISGVVTSVKNHEVIIDNTTICNLKSIDASIKVDQNVVMKGRVVGFDDLMGELKLDQCFIKK